MPAKNATNTRMLSPVPPDALIVAEAQVTLKRIRRARAEIMDQMSAAPPTRQSDGLETAPMPQMERNLRHLDQLLRIERYECRALSLRKRALRLAMGR
jgi:hypothetical protein